MLIQTVLLLVSFALAALLGFAAHRANICTVKAVEEVLTTRRAFMLVSFGKTILWIMAVTTLLLWVLPEARAGLTGWRISLYGLAGGVVFGTGAVLNGGCAFSTLTRLGDGEVSMLLTLAGFVLGVAAHSLLASQALVPPALAGEAFLAESGDWILPLLAGLSLWGLWEAWRLWRSRPVGRGPGALILADRYRLSTAAFLIGASSAVLYRLHGEWTYTSTLARSAREVMSTGMQWDPVAWLLFLGLSAGVVISALQRRQFRIQWPPRITWSWNLVGGVLMGFGAALVPGGNAVLLLHGIPTLSAHALPAYLAMLVGIAVTLGLMRLAGGSIDRIDCGGDICGD